MLIAHITDTHVRPVGVPAYRVVETNMLTERAIGAVAALRPVPEALIITGDLTDCGLVEEYELFAGMLKRLAMPVYVLPGNHDRRENLKAALAAFPGVADDPEFVQYTADIGNARLIVLDTVIPGSGAGALCDRRLDFFERALAEKPEAPTLVAMHHPPFVSGIAHMDAIMLLEGCERFRAIVAANPQIRRILCGHHHRPIQSILGNALAMVAPSVAHQVVLDINPDGPSAFTLEPPAYLLHALTNGGDLVTHTAYVETYPGPFPFFADPRYPGM